MQQIISPKKGFINSRFDMDYHLNQAHHRNDIQMKKVSKKTRKQILYDTFEEDGKKVNLMFFSILFTFNSYGILE